MERIDEMEEICTQCNRSVYIEDGEPESTACDCIPEDDFVLEGFTPLKVLYLN